MNVIKVDEKKYTQQNPNPYHITDCENLILLTFKTAITCNTDIVFLNSVLPENWFAYAYQLQGYAQRNKAVN